MTEVELEGRRLTLTNLDRVLWPRAGFTKRDLIDYYVGVAPVLLPHLARRALTLWRFPLGVHERGWWQNECRGSPEWVATATIRGQRFCVVDDLPSLVWVANQGTVELHPFPSRVETPEQPTAVLFDLDPGPPADLLDCCTVALELRDRLSALALESLAKTSGAAGIHVVVPLNVPHAFERTKRFARSLADALAAADERVTATMWRAQRRGKVLVDWLQNDPARSTVAPYSLRAAPWPTVSMPLAWEELEAAASARRPEALVFGAADARERVERAGDVFAPVLELEQELPPD